MKSYSEFQKLLRDAFKESKGKEIKVVVGIDAYASIKTIAKNYHVYSWIYDGDIPYVDTPYGTMLLVLDVDTEDSAIKIGGYEFRGFEQINA